jgi:CheY-like chemotaxis protein
MLSKTYTIDYLLLQILLRFNAKNDNISNFTSNSPSPSFDNAKTSFDSNRLIAVDTIRLDEHSRLTPTKKVKNVFPIMAGDIIVAYQDKYNKKELLFKIQRGNNIVDNWIVKRKDVDGIDKNPSQAYKINAKKKIAYDDNATTYLDNQNKIPSIILIDDEQDIVYSFKTILSDHGYNVKSFTESKEALKHIIELNYCSSSSNTITTTTTSSQSNHYDLAIIDIRMPYINGIQLYQILKIINKNIKVLFVSALEAAEEILSMFPEVKPSSIIRKPISVDYFIEKVQESINSRRN